jgi:hypothetical protein
MLFGLGRSHCLLGMQEMGGGDNDCVDFFILQDFVVAGGIPDMVLLGQVPSRREEGVHNQGQLAVLGMTDPGNVRMGDGAASNYRDIELFAFIHGISFLLGGQIQ